MAEPLEDRLARLERERQDADRQYNEALTALDQALGRAPAFPDPPAAYDSSKLADVNRAWDVLPAGAPAIDGSLKGRLRGLVWRIVGPPLETQRQFNAAIVEHLNRNVAAHADTSRTLGALVEIMRARTEADAHFHARLVQLLQTVTLYVDTKDRSTAGGQDVLNAGLSAVADTWLKHWESLGAREARFLASVRAIDDVKTTAALAQQTSLALKREVERLITAASGAPGTSGTRGTSGATGQTASSSLVEDTREEAAPDLPDVPVLDLNAFKYLAFEDQFRGSPEEIGRRLAGYVALFEGQTDVLDLGCGRGEFLELLRTHGIPARGLDSNLAMVEASRARGLDVTQGDALSYLSGLPDGSIGGMFAAQVVEHLPPDYLSKLLEAAAHKIRGGGVIVLETINPACWLAFFESYIRDLTHVRPLHPETLQFLVRVSGFHDVRVQFTSPVADAERLALLPPAAGETAASVVDAFNENVTKLNARLFGYQDYAVIGRTPR